MTWFRIDDSFGSHPKVLGIPRKDRATAVGLWTLAGVWCARNLTDGFLGEHMVDELGVAKRYASILVNAKLWVSVPGGYQFHNWLEYQPSRAEIEQRREDDRVRKAEAREAARKARGEKKLKVVNP